MKMNPVESSNVAEVGYEPDILLLRVKYKDGATYDRPGVTPDKFAVLMAADSIGVCLARNFAAGTRLPHPTPGYPAPAAANPQDEHKETFAEDDCCTRRIMKANRNNMAEWTCPECDTLWRPRMIETLKHWEPTASPVLVLRG